MGQAFPGVFVDLIVTKESTREAIKSSPEQLFCFSQILAYINKKRNKNKIKNLTLSTRGLLIRKTKKLREIFFSNL
jgi:hypothetical protein